MRDVNSGWLLRYINAHGASFFLFWTYLHIARGLYYGSYRAPRRLLWSIGVVILILLIGTAFLGVRGLNIINYFSWVYMDSISFNFSCIDLETILLASGSGFDLNMY
jgi:hypothetical protein